MVSANGTSGLTKAGLGTLILTASNTYTGGTTLNEGTLWVTGSGSINTPANDLDIAQSMGLGTESATLQMDSSTAASALTNLRVGNGGSGTVNQTAGTGSVAGSLIINQGQTGNAQVGLNYGTGAGATTCRAAR